MSTTRKIPTLLEKWWAHDAVARKRIISAFYCGGAKLDVADIGAADDALNLLRAAAEPESKPSCPDSSLLAWGEHLLQEGGDK